MIDISILKQRGNKILASELIAGLIRTPS